MTYINTKHCVNAWDFKTSSAVFCIHSVSDSVDIFPYSTQSLAHTSLTKLFWSKSSVSSMLQNIIVSFQSSSYLIFGSVITFSYLKPLFYMSCKTAHWYFSYHMDAFFIVLLPFISLTLKFWPAISWGFFSPLSTLTLFVISFSLMTLRVINFLPPP